MADVKISELGAATTPLAGTETAEIVQGGVNKRVDVIELGPAAEVAEARGARSTLARRINTIGNAASPNGVPVVVGRWYDGAFHSANPATLAGAANRIDLGPYFSSNPMRIDRAAVAVSTAVASAQVKIVIYEADPDTGVPTTLLFESAALDASSTGAKEATLDLTLEAGRFYWLGTRHSSTATLRTVQSSSALNFGMSSSASSTYLSCLRRTLTFATAAPTDWAYVDSDPVFATPPSVRLRAQALA